MEFIAGLDPAQAADYSALCILEVKEGKGKNVYHLRHMERVRQVPYPEIVLRVAKLLASDPLRGSVSLVIDNTGVGRAVVDLFREAVSCPLAPVTITGGFSEACDKGEWHVPKTDLVSTIQAVGGTGRLKYSPSLPFASILDEELLNFRVKITDAAHASYGAWREGQHDDLVLSVSLALWWGERSQPAAFFLNLRRGFSNKFDRGD